MSRIRALTLQVASIPDKERRKNQVGELQAARDRLRQSADVVRKSNSDCGALESVSDTAFVPVAREALAKAGSSAKQLHDRLAKGGTIATDKKAESLLTTLCEHVSRSEKQIQTGWSVLVESCARRYQPLAEVATQVGLPGASSLDAAIAVVRGWTKQVPSSMDDANRFNEAREQIVASVTKLGFDGKAGWFMTKAAQGSAAARDLLDPEVVTFLDKYPTVWDLLKVKL